jgi:hypothetical protein
MGTAVIGAPAEFKARSGRVVKPGLDGSLLFGLTRGYIAPDEVMDAQEFFQAQGDIELGRWRYPLEPNRVVYADAETVRVFDEATGETVVYYRDDWPTNQPLEQTRIARDAANAYVKTHPERKPWQRAQVGEVWVLSTADGETDAYTAMPVQGVGVFFEAPEGRYSVDDDDIQSARRIWPEDAS